MPTHPKRVAWITGSAGFIGRHMTARFLDDGWSVIGIDRSPQQPGNALRQVTSAVTPAALESILKSDGPPDFVFHGAGTGSVGDSVRDPAASQRDTVTATEIMLDFLRARAPAARVLFPSSAAVYGSAEDAPLHEDRAANPVSPYGAYKLAAEKACVAAAKAGLPVTIVRLFSVYGAGLRKQLPWDLGRKLLDGRGDVVLSGTGDETRDFFHVSDVTALGAYVAGVNLSTPLIINGGTGVATRVRTFAAALAGLLSPGRKVTFSGEARVGDPRYYQADVKRLASIGFAPRVTLEAGMADYARWLKSAE